jgi:UPF0176 protein
MSDEQRARFAERQKQMDLAKARGEDHLATSLEEAKAKKAAHKAYLKSLSDKGAAK